MIVVVMLITIRSDTTNTTTTTTTDNDNDNNSNVLRLSAPSRAYDNDISDATVIIIVMINRIINTIIY